MRNALSHSLFAAMLVAFALLVTYGRAEAATVVGYHGGTYFGPVVIEPGEEVDGDLVVFFGDVTLDGRVSGDVTVIGGSAFIGPFALVGGKVNAFGGEVVGPEGFGERSFLPTRDTRVFWPIAWDVVALVVFLLFPLRARLALDRLERHPGLSAVAGVAGWLAVLPLALLLLCTVVLIPLIVLEVVGLAVGMFVGQAAIALLLGRRFLELLAPAMTPSPMAALIVGLVLVTAAELVPFAGPCVWGLVALAGLGAVLLSFVREETLTGTAARRPPVSGPPMPIS